MKISVAMATYNGEKYLQEQLDSLARQTRLPDELVVSDDASTDRTREILGDFASTAPFSVTVHINCVNLGYIKNFETALGMTTGQLIFLCDQDDRWYENKISRVQECFDRDESLLLAINDQKITDDNLIATPFTSMGNTERVYGSIDRFVSGCCCAFRGCLKDVLLPFPDASTPHDIWLNEVVGLLRSRLELREVLQDYRRHKAAVSECEVTSGKAVRSTRLRLRPGLRVNPRSGWERQLTHDRELLDRLIALDGATELALRCNLESGISVLRSRIAAFTARKALLDSTGLSRCGKAMAMLARGQYQYFKGLRSFAKDIIRPPLREST